MLQEGFPDRSGNRGVNQSAVSQEFVNRGSIDFFFGQT